MENSGFQYLAFISYSRADNEGAGRRWADWLKRTVEDFPLGNLQRSVFLDREKLPAGRELNSILQQHLATSKYLILIGSPRSARSKWVSAEIEWFKKCRGPEFIIPMVIDGNGPDSPAGDHWVADTFRELAHLTYSDFRVKERQRDNSDIVEAGWTAPSFYRKHLSKRGIGSKVEILNWITKYEDQHKVARLALLSQLFGKPPEDLERIEIDHKNRTAVGRLRRSALVLSGLAMVLGGFLWSSVHWARKEKIQRQVAENERRMAESERLVAERSLMSISDAHEESVRLISDVLSELKAKGVVSESDPYTAARKMIDARLAESTPQGNDEVQIHMRAVTLDNRAYLARSAGDLPTALGFYKSALELREKLRLQEPDNAIYLHNLSVSHDHLGDILVLQSEESGIPADRRNERLKMAESEYRESIEISRNLVARKDATNAWRHDLAVGLFKLGDTLSNRDDEDFRPKAIDSLKEGMGIARDLIQRDSGYAKWQAHLAYFCLKLGQILVLEADDPGAKSQLLEGKAILTKLRDQGRLTHQYRSWLDAIESSLQPLE